MRPQRASRGARIALTGWLFAIVFILCACAASPPLELDGNVLQSGPHDAPLLETEFETPSTCEMMLKNFDTATQRTSRCVSKLSSLPYTYDVTMDLFGNMRVYASTLETCEASRKKAMGKPVMKVVSRCKKILGEKK